MKCVFMGNVNLKLFLYFLTGKKKSKPKNLQMTFFFLSF